MIYLDHNAITQPYNEVKKIVYDLIEYPYNVSSIHAIGQKAKYFVNNARHQLFKALSINTFQNDYHVIFTATGTEANNLILSNFANSDIFISAVEHPSILKYIKYKNVKIINVDQNGIIDFNDLEVKLDNNSSSKKLLSVMLVNNETGVIQPIKQITKIAKHHNTYVHTDCIQGLGKIPIDIKDLGVDFATFSAHKIGGISGAAALLYNKAHKIKPILIGGMQEFGIRPGTENVAAIAGFGLAVEIASVTLKSRNRTILSMREKLEHFLSNEYPGIMIAGNKVNRVSNTSLIFGSNVDSQTQLISFDLSNIAVGAGSACASGKLGKSHVLKAMGYDDKLISSAIRVSLSHNNSDADIDAFIRTFKMIQDRSYEQKIG